MGSEMCIRDRCLVVCGEDEHNTLIVSVPNGAPSKVKDNAADDKKYDYLRDAETILSNIDQSILLTDQDTAGDSLKEVLGRRIEKPSPTRLTWVNTRM